MDGDDLSDVLDDANPRCPKCLVPLDIDQEFEMVYLECPSCHDFFM